jgi:hypothetical protein
MQLNRLLPAIVVFGIFIATAAAVVDTVTHAIETERYLRKAQIDRATTLRHQIDAETRVRGYAVTGDAIYIKPYEIALRAFGTSIFQLRSNLSALGMVGAVSVVKDESLIHRRWLVTFARPLDREAAPTR